MKPIRNLWIACAILFACGLVVISFTTKTSAARKAVQDAVRRDQDLDKVFRQRELIKLDPARAAEQVRGAGQVTLTANDKTYQLVLEPNDMRSPIYRAEVTRAGGVTSSIERGEVTTYKGFVRGMDDAEARFTIDSETFEGMILAPDASYFVEPARRYSAAAAADEFVLYNAADLLKSENISCGNETLNQRVNEAVKEAAPRAEAAQATTLLVVELATEADFEYVTQSESTPGAGDGVVRANNDILSIMNLVDGVYRREIGVTFSITFQHAWATPDPFSDASQVALVNSFKDYWNANFTTVQRDLAHLWSGAAVTNLSGLTYVGSVCNTVTPGFAYGVHGRVVDAPQKFVLSAHELGHSLGAPAQHPDTVPGCAGTIMVSSSGPNSVLTFCQVSRDAIVGYVTTHTSCLTSITVRSRFDFDGDRKADLAVFRPGTNYWYALNSATGGFKAQLFGAQGDIAAPEDYDGDGIADFAVFRPSTGSWYLLQSRAGFAGRQFGASGDKPVSQDYDGDGSVDIAVYRPSTGAWYIANSGNGSVTGLFFGAIGDLPAPEDYDGDGRADIAVFRPSTGVWYIQQSTAGFRGLFFGSSVDTPVPADYDGDGKADIAVWRNTDGGWYILNSATGGFRAQAFGTQGDVPAPSAYVP